MTSPAARVGDLTCTGGVITCGSGDVFVNGNSASIAAGSVATCPLHLSAQLLATGSGSVFINGFPAAFAGSVTSCGDAIVSGSCDVFIGP